MKRMGIDWGGTKIEAAVLADDNSFLFRERLPSPGSYDEAIETTAGFIEMLEERFGRCSIGFGIPGSISPQTGLVRGANSTYLNGRPLQRDLEARLKRELRFANDANCFAVSEAKDGAAVGAGVVLGVIIGTGTGSGIVVNGRLLQGHHGIAGEFGHVALPHVSEDDVPGTCWCGRANCTELFLSGPGFARVHAAHTGEMLRAEQIIARMRQGDAEARRSYERYVDQLARGLSLYLNTLDPDVIVLGGGMGQIDKLEADVLERLPPYTFSDFCQPRIVKPRYGPSSGVRGAAWLWQA